MAGDDVDLYNRLIAAACVDVNCSGEFAKGSQDYIHYSQIEASGTQDNQALNMLWAAHLADPQFLSYSVTDQGVDDLTRAGNTVGQQAVWAGQFAASAGSTFVNGAKEFGLQILDGLSALGGGAGDPVSQMGQSIQQNGVVQTATDAVAGFSDTMKGVGQGDPQAVGALAGMVVTTVVGGKIGGVVSGLDATGSVVAADAAAGSGTSTVFRVQGGVMPNASKTLVTLDADGNLTIQGGTLNVSIGDPAHAQYF